MKPFLLTTAFTVLLFSFTAIAQATDKPASISNTENKHSTLQVDQVIDACKYFDDFTIAQGKETIERKLQLKKSPIPAWEGRTFIKYWVDDKQGRVYRLSALPDNFNYNSDSRSCKIYGSDRIPDSKIK